MFTNLSIAKKIGLGFGAVILIAMFLGGMAIWNMSNVQTIASHLVTKNMPEIDVANEVERQSNEVMLASRSYGLSGLEKYKKEAFENFKEVLAVLKKAEEHAAKEDLAELGKNAKEAKEYADKYQAIMVETVELTEGNRALFAEMASIAANYMKACHGYIQGQTEAYDKDIKNLTQRVGKTLSSQETAEFGDRSKLEEALLLRMKKVTTILDIIELGNSIRVDVLYGTLYSDHERLKKAEPKFPEIQTKLESLRPITRQPQNIQQLDLCRDSFKSYHDKLTLYLTRLQAAESLGKQRLEASSKMLGAAKNTAKVGMDDTTAAATRANNMLGRASMIMVIGLAIGLAIGIVLTFVIARAIGIPMGIAVQFLNQVAGGDLSSEVPEIYLNRNDEIGGLARSVQKMVENLRGVVRSLLENSRTLANASTELAATATQLANGAEETTNQSAQVAAAAEEMSTNMNNMAASTEQMSANVQTVASAVEELTASISEVAKSAEQSAGVASNAAKLAEASDSQIGQLGEAADQIGKVIEVIQDIAEQTNLLALNATIEAARAGDAGKGFAVVATEVKELAKQTAGATEDIRKRIEGIQGSTGLAVKSIAEISEVIRRVNDLSRTIASAVEEQSITTKEIAKNVAQSSTAATTVSKGVNESATAAQEITHNIVGVDQAAKQAAQGASQTQEAGRELSQLAEQLQTIVGQFKLSH